MSQAWLEHLRDLFAPVGALSARRMFGGHGLYLDGVLVGVLFGDTLYLKVDEATQGRFEAAGGTPYVYRQTQEPITMSYWSLPADAMDSPEAMEPWARRALQAALRSRATPPGSRRPR